jgi:proteasome lid subunit RPN8/RPN11
MSTDDTFEAAKHGQSLKAPAGALTVAPEDPGDGAGEFITPPHEVEGLDDESRVTVFGELQPPDVHSEPFPRRLLHWKPSGKAEPQPGPISIVVTQEVLESVNRHVSRDLQRELGGFLLGNRYFCPNSKHSYVRIDVCTEAKFASSTPISMEMVNNTFLHLCEELSGKYRGKDVIGWYHSHPKHEVFLSPDDIDVHESRFKHDWMVALVINPNKKLGAFFRRHDGVLNPRASTDFYELLGIGAAQTMTCVPWGNYHCYDVETGRMISPRPAEEEKQRDSTDETSSPLPPWWLSPPQWLSLPQVKPTAFIIGALMFGIILYSVLSRNTGESGQLGPSEKPGGPEIAQLNGKTQPSPLPPDDRRVADQTQAVQVQESTQSQESESSNSHAEGSSSNQNSRARADAGGRASAGTSTSARAAKRRETRQQSRQAPKTESVTTQTGLPKPSPALPPARRNGAFGKVR